MATEGKRKTTRLNLDVGKASRESLERLSKATGQSISDLIRNALDLYDQLYTELSEDSGRTLMIIGPRRERTKILLPGFGIRKKTTA
jgi:hypothetical protein